MARSGYGLAQDYTGGVARWIGMPPLEPQLEVPRARVDRRAVAIGAIGAIGLAAGGAIAMRASSPPNVIPPPPIVIAPRAPAPAPAVVADPPAPVAAVARGTCDVSLLPPGYVEHVSDADAAALATMVGAWIGDPSPGRAGPSLEYRRGIVFVQSEEDRGDDPPYPRSAAPQAQRACGSAAIWLRTHVRDGLPAYEGALTCDGNVCCYDGSEYAPSGVVVFHAIPRDGGTTWALAAWMQVYTAALGPDVVRANTRFVTSSLRRLAPTRCPGEPAGAD